MDDLISRQAAIDAVMALEAEDDEMYGCSIPESFDGERAVTTLKQLPSAHHFDEWCTDCKEYDQEKHCCPRYNRVIRRVLNEALPKRGRWLPVRGCDGGYWVCSSCKNPTEAFAADVLYKYCPFCGADMRGEKE